MSCLANPHHHLPPGWGVRRLAFPKEQVLCVGPEHLWLTSSKVCYPGTTQHRFPCRSYTVSTQEFMDTDLVLLAQEATFHDILQVVTMTDAQEYPVVDNAGTVVF